MENELTTSISYHEVKYNMRVPNAHNSNAHANHNLGTVKGVTEEAAGMQEGNLISSLKVSELPAMRRCLTWEPQL